MIGIYKITNIINQKCYIGKSIDIERRWQEHKTNYLRKNTKEYNCVIYRAFRKYGIENFTFEVIEECSLNCLSEKEQYWIHIYDSKKHGYNMTDGGEGKITIDREKVKELWDNGMSVGEIKDILMCGKSSITRIVKNFDNYSKEESKKRGDKKHTCCVEQYDVDGNFVAQYNSIIEASNLLNIPMNNIYHCLSGKYHTAGGFQWKRKSDKKEIVAFKKNSGHPPSIAVKQYDLNGNFIKEYVSIKQASRELGISDSSIIDVCKGKSHTAGNYIWRYTTDDTPVMPQRRFRNKVLQYDMNGNFINEFSSLTEASKQTGVYRSTIGLVCNNKAKTAGGFIWRFANNKLEAAM